MKNYRSTIIGLAVLVVLLSAGAAQSLAGSNTVTSDDIVDFSIVANDVKTAAIGGRPIVDNSLTGADIDERTLSLQCPTLFVVRRADVCAGGLLGPAGWETASNVCADNNVRLPTMAEAKILARASNGGELTYLVWTDLVSHDGDRGIAMATSGTNVAAVALETGSHKYFCVTTVGARP